MRKPWYGFSECVAVAKHVSAPLGFAALLVLQAPAASLAEERLLELQRVQTANAPAEQVQVGDRLVFELNDKSFSLIL